MAGLAMPRRARAPFAWRPWALWGSLALNVFLLALAAGPVLHPRPPRPSMVERLTRGMPDADAARFRAAMEAERPLFALAQDRVEDARAALASAIARTPFDEALVRQRLAEFQQRLREQSERIADSLLPTVATLSPDARQRLADAVERPPGPPHSRGNRAP